MVISLDRSGATVVGTCSLCTSRMISSDADRVYHWAYSHVAGAHSGDSAAIAQVTNAWAQHRRRHDRV